MSRFARLGLLLGLVGMAGCKGTVRGGECEPGRVYCEGDVALTCLPDGSSYEREDCAETGRVCGGARGCLPCHPSSLTCDGDTVVRCTAEATGFEDLVECDVGEGQACYLGNCVEACEKALKTL